MTCLQPFTQHRRDRAGASRDGTGEAEWLTEETEPLLEPSALLQAKGQKEGKKKWPLAFPKDNSITH